MTGVYYLDSGRISRKEPMQTFKSLVAISLALMLGSIAANAAKVNKGEPDVLSVIAEREHPIYFDQSVQLIIRNEPERKKAILTVTSNYLFPQQDKVRLGHYETTDLRRMDSWRRQMANIQKFIRNERIEADPTLPGLFQRIRVFFGGFELDLEDPRRNDALNFLESAWDYGNWLPIDGIEIHKKKGSREVVLVQRGRVERRNKTTIDALKCTDVREDRVLCKIPRFGSAYLWK